MVHPLTVLLFSILILAQLLNADAEPKKSTEVMAAHFRMATKAFIGHPHEEYSNEEEEEKEHKPLDKHKSDEKTISDRLRAELKSYYDGNEENVCKWVAVIIVTPFLIEIYFVFFYRFFCAWPRGILPC
jgi:hypothetical protein